MRPHIKERLSTWEGLADLVQIRTEEASDLDFKQEAYASANKSDDKKKKDKVELRRDVVSFSNAEGGTIILGIAENSLGQAAELTGIGDFRNAEIIARDVLSQFITPALGNRDLQVSVIRNPEDPTLAAIVITVGPASPGRPRAVINERAIEFWIREGTSKRNMTYEQIEQAFHSNHSAEEKRSIDASAKHEVMKIKRQLSKASTDWQEIAPLLEHLSEYVVEHQYGQTVLEAVFEAACTPLERTRLSIPYEIARNSLNLIDETLPIHSLVSKAHRKITETELELLRRAAEAATDLIYDATRRLHDIILIAEGAQLLNKILRFAHLNMLEELKRELLETFDERASWAEQDGIRDGSSLLRYYQEDALAPPPEPLVDVPVELAWLILESPNTLPEQYKRADL